MNPLFRLAAVGIVVGAVLGGAASATQSATMPGPSRLPLEFNADGAIRQDANGGLGWDRTGKWQTTRMHYEGGRLVLTIDITPPFTGLPGRSGPAVLFGRLSLLAGHGEIGWQKQAEPIVWAILPTCAAESDCSYHGRIALTTAGLYGTWASESGLESPGAVVDLSLVRTFDRGRWIQVMPLFTDTGGYTRAGTVGKPTPISGPVLSFGAFPASEAQRTRDLNRSLDYAAVVEHARRELGDPSTELPHVDGQLDLRLVGCRGYNVEIRDPDWNMAMYLGNPRRGVALRRRISLIDGRDWSVVVGGTTLGSFTTAGSDVLLEGTVACGRPPSGTVSAAATDLPPTSLPPTDAGPANERRTPAIALFALLAVFASALAASFVGMRRRRRQAAQS